jgi:hypothetical protein
MTEEEATAKFCCGPLQMTSALMTLSAAFIKDADALEEEYPSRGRCIGSACMAWRWTNIHPPANQIGPSDLDGHCGLAGEP